MLLLLRIKQISLSLDGLLPPREPEGAAQAGVGVLFPPAGNLHL